jgi:hypothetical protein
MEGTVLSIIQQTCTELGLPEPNEAVASNDTTIKQLVALLNKAGYELCRVHEWQFLDRIGIITTVAGQDEYDLPSDWSRSINQTLWSSTLELTPVTGPLSPQLWQSLKNGSLGSGIFQSYRIRGNKLVVDPVPGNDGETYNFEYISNAWIKDGNQEDTYISRIMSDTDVPLFDEYLLVSYLKVKLWTAKGLDTTEYKKDFGRLFDAIVGTDKDAPMLSLTNRYGYKYLSGYNVPEGNWRVQ